MDELALFNQNLNGIDATDEVKAVIKDLVEQFKKYFPNVSIANLISKISSLEIKPGSKFEIREACKYNGKSIEINNEKFAESDAKHQIMSILIKIIAETKDGYGFANDQYLKVLNVGVVDMVATTLVKGKDIEDENATVTKEDRASFITSLLFLNDSKCIDAFFNHDVNYVQSVINKAKNPNDIYNILEKMSYETEPTCEVQYSSFVEAENAILKSYATPENINDYKLNIIINENVIGVPVKGVDQLLLNIKEMENGQQENKTAVLS